MEKVDIATLEALRDSKERELKILEKEIADARRNDLRVRFNMIEGKYYKIKDNRDGVYYFQYTEENTQFEYNQLTVFESIYRSSTEKYCEIALKGTVIFDLAPVQRIAINDDKYSSLLHLPFCQSEPSLRLFGEDSLKIEEADDIEIGKLKVELMERAERF
jgi:hypothetical protein